MMSIAPLLLCLLPALQEPQPSPSAQKPDSSAGAWQPQDQVVVIVNADIITAGELLRAFRRELRARPGRSERESQRLMLMIKYEFVRQKLAAQAGQDLGANEQLVDQIVKQKFDRWVEFQGGVVEATKVLESREMTTQEYRRGLRDEFYATTWRDMVTGEGPGVGKRPQRDRFVRPGLMKFRFNNEIQDPARYGELGGIPASFSMQTIILDPDEYGGAEKTKEFVNDLRERILAGEDMTELVQKYGAIKDDNGYLRKLSLERMKRLAPEVAAWAESAEIEGVSGPLPYETETKVLWQVCRLIEREEAEKPELESPAVQAAMTKALQEEWDQHRLSVAYEKLFRAAYVWPEELRGEEKR